MITLKKSAALDLFWPAMHAYSSVQIVLHTVFIQEIMTLRMSWRHVGKVRAQAQQNVHWFYTVPLYFLKLDAWDLLLWTQFSPQMLQLFRQQYSSTYLPNGANYFLLCSVNLEKHKVLYFYKHKQFKGLELTRHCSC